MRKEAPPSKTEFRRVAGEVNVFLFLNFREYLRAIQKRMKATRRSYNDFDFSRDLGLGTSNSVQSLLRLGRGVRVSTIEKLVIALGLRNEKRLYFQALVAYFNAHDGESQSAAYAEVMAIRDRNISNEEHRRQLAFFREWYHATILETLDLPNVKKDAISIAKIMNIHLTREQVQQSLELLVELGYAKHDADSDEYVKITGDIVTAREVAGHAYVAYHNTVLDLAKESLAKMQRTDRQLIAITTTLSQEDEANLREKLDKLSDEIAVMSMNSQKRDRVIQVVLHFFQLTK